MWDGVFVRWADPSTALPLRLRSGLKAMCARDDMKRHAGHSTRDVGGGFLRVIYIRVAGMGGIICIEVDLRLQIQDFRFKISDLRFKI